MYVAYSLHSSPQIIAQCLLQQKKSKISQLLLMLEDIESPIFFRSNGCNVSTMTCIIICYNWCHNVGDISLCKVIICEVCVIDYCCVAFYLTTVAMVFLKVGGCVNEPSLIHPCPETEDILQVRVALFLRVYKRITSGTLLNI